MKFLIVLVLIYVVQVSESMSVSSCFNELTNPITKTGQINKKLCEAGTHNDEVTKKFDECYNTSIGGSQYIKCQLEIYGHKMDTEANVDDVCTSNKFKQYAFCIVKEFAKARINPYSAIKSLMECQGPILGIDVSPNSN